VLLAVIGVLVALVVGGPVGVLVGIAVPGIPAGMVALAGYAANLLVVRPVARYERGWEVSIRGKRAFWPWGALELKANTLETSTSNHAIALAHPSTRLQLVVQSGIHGQAAVDATLAHMRTSSGAPAQAASR
jgi:hypothetical protein